MDIGEKIKKLREEKQKTQLDVSKALGVTYQTIYKYEKGIAVPPADALVKLAEYFNVTTDYLLGRTDTYNPSEEKLTIAASMKNGLDISDMTDEEKKFINDFINMVRDKKK